MNSLGPVGSVEQPKRNDTHHPPTPDVLLLINCVVEFEIADCAFAVVADVMTTRCCLVR